MVLPAVLPLSDDQRVVVLLQRGELQLALRDLVQDHAQQAVLVQLTQVVDACGGVSGTDGGRVEEKTGVLLYVQCPQILFVLRR